MSKPKVIVTVAPTGGMANTVTLTTARRATIAGEGIMKREKKGE